MDRERVLAAYAALADEYERRVADELRHKPFDRAKLDALAAESRRLGRILDVGTGPGHVARYLRDAGADVLGGDLSEAMLEHARRRNPDIEFRRLDMLALDLPDASIGAVSAFYAIVHFTLDDVETAFREVRRILVPGGVALVAFHVGNEVVRVEEEWGVKIDVEFVFFQPEDVAARAGAAGLVMEEVALRDPYPRDVEYPSRRAYLTLRR
jgi:ubiquinone/menaquinone biosynthesis C-methylase UbiE